MLDEATYDLAQTSYMGQRTALMVALPNEIQLIISRFLSRGIHGGPTAGEIISAGAENLRARSRIAAAELIRACESRAVVYSPQLRGDLEEAFDRMTLSDAPGIVNDIAARAGGLPNPGAVRANAEGVMLQARLQGRVLAVAEFGHFVSGLEVAARERAAHAEELRKEAEVKRRPSTGQILAWGGSSIAIITGMVKAIQWVIAHWDAIVNLVTH